MFNDHQTCPHCDGAIAIADQHVQDYLGDFVDVYLLCLFCNVCIYGRWDRVNGALRNQFRLDYRAKTEPTSYAGIVAEMRYLQRRRRTYGAVCLERRRRQGEALTIA